MTQIPNHLHTFSFGSAEHRQQAAEVVFAGAGFKQVPTQAVAGGGDTLLSQTGIILRGELIVAGSNNQIEAATMVRVMGRTFKPAEKIALENVYANIRTRFPGNGVAKHQ